MRFRLPSRALFGALMFAPGCAYYSQADGDRLHDEVYALQQQVTVLQQKLEASESANAEQRGILSKIEDELRKKGGYDADFGVQLDEMRTALARMEGQVGALDQRSSTVEEQTEKTREEMLLIEKRLDVAEGKAEVGKAEEALLQDPNQALGRAEKLIEEGKPAEARALVRTLEMKSRGEAGWGVYAPKAQYLIAESYYAEKEWRRAVAAFNKVRKNHPEAKIWMPGTLLRLGQCLQNLGFDEDAALLYEQAAKQFPKHPNGKEAKRLLAKLRR